MAGPSREDFARKLNETGLMSADEANRLLGSLPDDSDPSTDLVNRQLLTEFQASVLGNGPMQTLVLGNYVVQDKLGEGGMGIVYLAKHRRMKRVVALKTLSQSLTSDEEALNRFQREVELLSRLQHANIVTAYDADEANGIHYLVLEYVKGCDLRALIRRDGPLPVRQAIELTRQAAAGLAYAHRQGIIHRDVKPSNLLVDLSGTLKILDLGLARFSPSFRPDVDDMTDAEITSHGAVMGTASYMAPEQGIDTGLADERSDIYSLGCAMYFMLAGLPPVLGDTALQRMMAHRSHRLQSLAAARTDVPAELCEVFERMTATLPEHRYQSMDEVAEALDRIDVPEDLAPDLSVPVGFMSPEVDVSQTTAAFGHGVLSHRAVIPLGTLLVLTLVALLVMFTRGGDDQSRPESLLSPQAGTDTDGLPTEPERLAPPPREFAELSPVHQWWDFVAMTGEPGIAVAGGGYHGDGNTDYPIVRWQIADGTLRGELRGPTSWVWCGDVSRDGRFLLAGTGPSPHPQGGRRLGGEACDVFVWDLISAGVVARFPGHGNTVRAAKFLPDSQHIVSGGHDSTLRLWDIATVSEVHRFENDSGEVLSLATSNDGRWIASGHWSGVDLWDVASKTLLHHLQAPKVLSLAFSHDGHHLALGTGEGQVQVVRPIGSDGVPEVIARFPAHQGRVKCLAWLPDDRRLISGSDEGANLRLWDALAGEDIPWFEAGGREVKDMAITDDGLGVLTACADGTIQRWELPD